MNPIKLAILTNMVAPYRVPFFRGLANQPEIQDLTILTCVDKEVDREWEVENSGNYQVKKLFGITLNLNKGSDAKRIIHLRFGILFYLLFNRPDKLVIGDASWTSYMAAFFCRLLFIPYIVWNEITTSSKVSEGMSAKLRRFMYRGARKHIASCQLAKDFLILNGVNEQKIGIVNNAVDNDFFLAQRKKWESSRDQVRQDLGIAKDAFCFIYVGQLISRKKVVETVEWVAIQKEFQSVHLLVVGSGPLESEMKVKAESLNFENIHFCGFAKPEQLSQYYVASDGLVLFSEDEPWGMVVNEALLFGKHVFASKNVGAAYEFSYRENVHCMTDLNKSLLDIEKRVSNKELVSPNEMVLKLKQILI
jgi:glycosyltransferase involved in cell wall biosynthesis